MRMLKRLGRMLMLACVMAMWMVFGAVTLPTNPSQSSATVGKDYLLFVNTGTVAVPVWTLIGGQRGSSLGRTAEEIDVSHKTSGGWTSIKAGLRSWSIDLDGLMLLRDDGVAALEHAFMNGLEVNIKLQYPDGTAQVGWGSVTDFSMETPHDGEASLSGTISGNGPLSERTPSISPVSATVSLAATTNVVITVTPTTTTISGVKDNGASLTVSTDYTYSSGTLTIMGDYLETIAIGTHTFAATTGDNTTLTILITVTA